MRHIELHEMYTQQMEALIDRTNALKVAPRLQHHQNPLHRGEDWEDCEDDNSSEEKVDETCDSTTTYDDYNEEDDLEEKHSSINQSSAPIYNTYLDEHDLMEEVIILVKKQKSF